VVNNRRSRIYRYRSGPGSYRQGKRYHLLIHKIIIHDLEIIAEKNLSIGKGMIAACGVRIPGDVQDEIILFVLHKGTIEGFIPQISALKRAINETGRTGITEVIPLVSYLKLQAEKYSVTCWVQDI
jgi:hypothetical protein